MPSCPLLPDLALCPVLQSEYLYYGIPSPWLQSKCLRALQYFPAPENMADKQLLHTLLKVGSGLCDSCRGLRTPAKICGCGGGGGG